MRRFHPGTDVAVSPGNLHSLPPVVPALMLNKGEVVLVSGHKGMISLSADSCFNFLKGQKRAQNTLVSSVIEILSVISNGCPLPPLTHSKQRAVCLIQNKTFLHKPRIPSCNASPFPCHLLARLMASHFGVI